MTDTDIAISVAGLGKMYRIYDRPVDRLKQMLWGRLRARGYGREFWALREVSFQVRRGETLGIIGLNGSGKSTLLQSIGGVQSCTTGSVEVRGRLAALLELGAGFNPDFTGRENVHICASVLGLSRAQIDERFAAIAAFADIGDFLEQPVKTYSSGMFVRLAFAVIAHVDADILIVDEALSVGDARFNQKCMRFMRNFMKQGTLLFCSHDIGAIANLCTRAIFMHQGRIVADGEPKEIINQYLASLHLQEHGEAPASPAASKPAPAPAEASHEKAATPESPSTAPRDHRQDLIERSTLRTDIQVIRLNEDAPSFGRGGARITDCRLVDARGAVLTHAVGGEDVTLEISCQAHEDLDQPIVGFTLKDRLGQPLFVDNTYLTYRDRPLRLPAGSTAIARFAFRFPILPAGDYSVSPAIAIGAQDNHVQQHWAHDALILRVQPGSYCLGVVGLPMRDISLEVTAALAERRGA
jgi:lipopolysaccharide transport system ATP-binding protein